MKIIIRRIFKVVGSLSVAGGFVMPLAMDFHAMAQTPAPQKGAKATSPAAKGSDAKSAAADAEARAKIMASPEWKQVSSEYSKWLSTQAIYTPADVQRISNEIAAQFQSMPVSEMQGYLDDWQAKLKVLNGKDFQDAQNWLGAYLAPTTDGYRRTTLKQLGLGDVANMTAAQLDDAILRIRANQMQVQQSQNAYAQSQQQMVQAVQRGNAASQPAQQPRYGSGPGYNTLQSPYRPPKYNPPPNPTPQFYVNGYGRVGYMLPF
jgi:hypothetical protein